MSLIQIVEDKPMLASLEHRLKAHRQPGQPYFQRDLVKGRPGTHRAGLSRGLPAWNNEGGAL